MNRVRMLIGMLVALILTLIFIVLLQVFNIFLFIKNISGKLYLKKSKNRHRSTVLQHHSQEF